MLFINKILNIFKCFNLANLLDYRTAHNANMLKRFKTFIDKMPNLSNNLFNTLHIYKTTNCHLIPHSLALKILTFHTQLYRHLLKDINIV